MVIFMNKKLVLLGAGLLLTAATASAQQHVTGKVIDSAGEPVMGATVRVAGTKIVTTTDASGVFKLTNVPASAKKLNVTYIGMQSQTVNVAGNVKVVLKDNELGEAVVVGYGTAKKVGTLVGSVKKVSGDVVEGKPSVNIADALQGQVAGMQVMNNTGDVGEVGNVSITIRGNGSIGASNTPLIVVDGSPAGTSILSMLSSSDIESVTTLKDASATSIYGSRAANGVIYITTKKGRRNEKAQVTLSQKVGWGQLARNIGNPMTADELLDFQLANGIIYADQYARYKAHGSNTDWQKYGFDNAAPMYNTEVSVRGGSENTNYYVSGSYLDQNGLTDFSGFKRYTLRTNLDSKVKDWLTIGVSQSIAYTERQRDGYTVQGTGNSRSFSGTAQLFPRYWDPYDPEYMKQHKIWGMEDWDSKYLLQMQPNHANDIVYNGSAYVQIQPVKGLTLRSQLGLFATETRASNRIVPSVSETIFGEPAKGSESMSRGAMWTITNTAEYKLNINEDHSLTLLAGQEGIKSTTGGFTATASGFEDDDLPLLSAATTPEMASQVASAYQFLSFFGRVDYGFKQKYYANFTVRSDASSRFSKDHRTALFYSGGLMWDAMAEKFMRPASDWLTNLQVKASVGSTGNSEVGNYGHLALSALTQYGGKQGFYFAQYANPNLGWEKQIQANFGFTAGFFGKLTLDVNAYYRKTKDMLMSVPLPYTTGMGSRMENIGEMNNRGVELELNYDIVRTRDFYLNVRATYAYNNNEIDKLFYGRTDWPVKDALINYQVGKGINFYMPIYAGVDKEDGAPMWYKQGHKGKPGHTFNPETMTKDESQLNELYQDTGKKQFAPHNGGFGVTASWKGLTLVADFTYVLGKYMVNNDYFFATSRANALSGYNQSRDLLTDMWQKPGDLASLPGFAYDSQFDTHLLENASFLRLKNLSLSYELPKMWMERTNFFSNIRLNFTTRNLFTVTKYKGADPEVNSNIARNGFPATRDYVFGVEFTF